ncbi:MAG: heme-binding beta-barrel domain-containing protein [Reichenbachiella sp.]
MSNEMNKNPLVGLLGTWEGNKGMDVAPKPDEDENNPYYETLIIEPVDIAIENAESQELTAVKYHQVVREISNDKISHSETGYWIWDNNENTIMCAFAIPRGVSVLAGGDFKSDEGDTVFSVAAQADSEDWGIVQSPFMKKRAKTLAFTREFTVSGNTLSYTQETTVDIYGKKKFAHIDENTLTKKG